MNLPGMTPFLHACGATGPLQVAIASPRHPDPIHYVLHQPFAVFGRDPRGDLMLHDAQVSQRHAYLQVLGGRAFCVDLGSRAGLTWDDQPGLGGWIDPQQQLGIGPYRVSVTAGCLRDPLENAFAYNPLSTQDTEPPGLPEVELTFANGAADKETWPMTCRLALVGRSAQCKVRLDGSSVSRFHCSLVRTPHGLWVVDLLGRGGITVNDQHIRYTLLHDGDRLQVGRFVVVITSTKIRTTSPREELPVAVMVDANVAQTGDETPDSPSDHGAMGPSYPPPAKSPGQALSASGEAGTAFLPLLNQFAMMQHQMFDQFQQAMVGMVQMFGALHREQMEAIREELGDLRSLTRELQGLQNQMASLPPLEQSALVGVAPASTSIDPTLELSLANLEQMACALGNGTAPDTVPGTAHESRRPSAVTRDPEELSAAENPVPSASGMADAVADRPVGETSLASELPSTESSRGPEVRSPEEIHAWLCKRMAALQQERQSRWRRILGILTGAGGQK
jgi:pSer/pThr/pTyr-binding forkhead associated (FHA) protein